MKFSCIAKILYLHTQRHRERCGSTTYKHSIGKTFCCLLLFLHVVVVGRRRPSMFFCVDSFQPWYSCCLYNSPVDVMRYIFFIISFKVHIGKIQQFSTNIDKIHLYRELKHVVWEWVYFWYAWTIFSVCEATTMSVSPSLPCFFCLIHIFFAIPLFLFDFKGIWWDDF